MVIKRDRIMLLVQYYIHKFFVKICDEVHVQRALVQVISYLKLLRL